MNCAICNWLCFCLLFPFFLSKQYYAVCSARHRVLLPFFLSNSFSSSLKLDLFKCTSTKFHLLLLLVFAQRHQRRLVSKRRNFVLFSKRWYLHMTCHILLNSLALDHRKIAKCSQISFSCNLFTYLNSCSYPTLLPNWFLRGLYLWLFSLA